MALTTPLAKFFLAHPGLFDTAYFRLELCSPSNSAGINLDVINAIRVRVHLELPYFELP